MGSLLKVTFDFVILVHNYKQNFANLKPYGQKKHFLVNSKLCLSLSMCDDFGKV